MTGKYMRIKVLILALIAAAAVARAQTLEWCQREAEKH